MNELSKSTKFLICMVFITFIAVFYFYYVVIQSYGFYPVFSENISFDGFNLIYYITGPILTITIVIVTYLAFKAKNDANNIIVKDQYKQKFETQFYFMLQQHSKNVKALTYRRKRNKARPENNTLAGLRMICMLAMIILINTPVVQILETRWDILMSCFLTEHNSM